MPMSPDPKNPMRYMMRLGPDDQMAVNQEHATATQALMAKCSAVARADTGDPAPSNPNIQRARRSPWDTMRVALVGQKNG